ncbi:MAG: radical SAM family heme chaperone HemW [Desulfobacterales bacterium]|nr:radical SAM family heme chaperone HemW [Desulfobacterales bacterium]
MTPAGIYLHIPFCARKCDYCDFYSVTDTGRQEAFQRALTAEIRRRAHSNWLVDSIYFGGGTPSLLAPPFFERLLAILGQAYRIQGGVEITLEANPGTVDFDRLAAYRAGGINRLNLGVQSFDDARLDFLGRVHSAAEARAAVAAARRAGFDNLGLDLIYGLPDQTVDAWQADLNQALAEHPEHLACYTLTYAPDTPLMRDRRSGGHVPAGEDQIAALFDTTSQVLCAAGFEHYEISNFAAGPQWRSRHNTKYWARAPYLGFGPSAHSFDAPRRSWNVADLETYIDRLDRGRLAEEGREVLDDAQEMVETVFLGLRQAAGIDLTAFALRFGKRLETRAAAVIEPLVAEGYLRLTPQRLTPTVKGMCLHDSISARLTGVL